MAPRAGIHQGLLHPSRQAEACIEVANESQSPVGGHPCPLNLHTQALMARELTRRMACLPHRGVFRQVMITLDPARKLASKASIP
jgi:hypothetical protein